jgi:glutathione S-transferase
MAACREPVQGALMLTLYYSPAATSFAVHVGLEESGLEYALHEVDLKSGAHHSPEYLAIHPLGRVPALRLPSGDVLTETPAILGFIADSAPERALLPVEPWPRARAAEWLSLFVSALHPTFLGFFRPSRYGDGPELHEALARASRERFFELLKHVERRLPDGPFVLGQRHSLCDPYAAMFFMWARHFRFPVAELPRYAALFERIAARPSFQRALAREGLIPPRSGHEPQRSQEPAQP